MSETVYMGPDEIRLSAGKFRTTRRYLRATAVSPLTVIAKSRTIDSTLNGSGQLSWRYSVNGVVLEYTAAGALTFNATVQGVKL